ncbi:hypothetical protein COP2_046300 [Malus domestica]
MRIAHLSSLKTLVIFVTKHQSSSSPSSVVFSLHPNGNPKPCFLRAPQQQPRQKGLEWDRCRRGLGGVAVKETIDVGLAGEQRGWGS